MSRQITDYLKEYRKNTGLIPVSPIWGGEKLFPFLCLDHRTIAEMLGFEVVQATPFLSTVKEGQLASKTDIDSFIACGHGSFGQGDGFSDQIIERELTYLRQMKQAESDKWIGGGCFGPLTVLSGILGIENLLRKTVREPDQVLPMLGIVTDLMKELAYAEAEAGADFFWIAEPLASVIAPKKYESFSGRWIREIYDAAGVPGFLHVCGNTDKHTPELIKCGASVLSIDSVTDIGMCISSVAEEATVMGNVSPVLLKSGSVDEVRAEVRSILKAVNGHDNFILSTGCSIIDGTPDENMNVLFESAGNA